MPKDIKFFKSNVKNKKYRVEFIYKNKPYKVNFGHTDYQQYKDSTPLKLYKHLNHGDNNRRKNYLSRSGGIRNKSGKLTKNDPESANYWSIRYLW